MPRAPGESDDAYAKRKKAEAKDKERKAATAKSLYGRNIDTTTVEDQIDPVELSQSVFKEGEWRPSWANVEFDDDACLKNVSKAGKAADGFYVPAGAILPLGAALPKMTVLKYGGYFPPGTSFPGGVMIPLHARMVNILPQQTVVPAAVPSESLCLLQ